MLRCWRWCCQACRHTRSCSWDFRRRGRPPGALPSPGCTPAERAGLTATLLFYEAPHRLASSLADLVEIFGPDRPAAVTRELTKRFEEVRRDTLGALAAVYGDTPPRGEITLVVGPAPDAPLPDAREIDRQLLAAMVDSSVKDAVALVAAATGVARKVVYARALALRSA